MSYKLSEFEAKRYGRMSEKELEAEIKRFDELADHHGRKADRYHVGYRVLRTILIITVLILIASLWS